VSVGIGIIQLLTWVARMNIIRKAVVQQLGCLVPPTASQPVSQVSELGHSLRLSVSMTTSAQSPFAMRQLWG
jgi:hypothetical protein